MYQTKKERRLAARIATEEKIRIAREIKNVEEKTQLQGKWESIEVNCPQCECDTSVYVYDDNQTAYCSACDNEFDIRDVIDAELYDMPDLEADIESLVSDDPETVKLMADRILAVQSGNAKCKDCNLDAHFGSCEKPNNAKQLPLLPGHTHKGGVQTGFHNSSGTQWNSDFKGQAQKSCYHRPQEIIDGETWGIWAGKKLDVEDHAKNFDIVMNLTFTSIKQEHVIPIAALNKWENYSCPFQELQMDWPDYGVIKLPREFWIELFHYLRDNNFRMLVFCQGGHGRTGTAIAVMLCIALGYNPKQAIEWVRRNYCTEAIETHAQELYVYEMAKQPEVKTEGRTDAVAAKSNV